MIESFTSFHFMSNWMNLFIRYWRFFEIIWNAKLAYLLLVDRRVLRPQFVPTHYYYPIIVALIAPWLISTEWVGSSAMSEQLLWIYSPNETLYTKLFLQCSECKMEIFHCFFFSSSKCFWNYYVFHCIMSSCKI